MARVKRGVTTRAKHKNILEQAKGYRGRRKNVYRIAKRLKMKLRTQKQDGTGIRVWRIK